MRKRLTAALLCLCMMLTLLPGTAYAAVGELLGNSRAENQALLEQLEALNGQDGEAIQALLEQYGLLDEDGNLDIDQTVELDGDAYTLAEIEALLDDPDADLSRVGYVDGVPIALGDLKTIIAIERELQRIQETYFSGKAFDGESLANLNSLVAQLQTTGITLRSAGVGETLDDVPALDVDDFSDLVAVGTNVTKYIPVQRVGQEFSVTVTLDPGLLTDINVRVTLGSTMSGVSEADTVMLSGSSNTATLTCTANNNDKVVFGGVPLSIMVVGAVTSPDYAYGELAAAVRFTDPQGFVFESGGQYYDAHTLRLTQTVDVPDLSTKWMQTDWMAEESQYSGNIEEENKHKSTDVYFEFLTYVTSSSNEALGITNDAPTAKRETINEFIRFLQGAKGYTDAESVPDDDAVQFRLTVGNLSARCNSDIMARAWDVGEYGPSNMFFLPEEEDADVDRVDLQTTYYGMDYSFLHINVGTINQITTPLQFDASTKLGTEAVPARLEVRGGIYVIGVGEGAAAYNYGILKDTAVELINDGKAPTLKSATTPSGSTYRPGQLVPVVLSFDELVYVNDDASISINDKAFTPGELHMSKAGNQMIFWYPVQKVDGAQVTITSLTGVTDIFGNAAEINGVTASGAALESALLREAATGVSVSYEEGQATVTVTLSDEEAYKNKYASYHQPASGEAQEVPFQAVVTNSAGTVIATEQVYVNEDGETFATNPFAVNAGAAQETYTVTLQVNEGTRETPDWVDLSYHENLKATFGVGALVQAASVKVSDDSDGNYTLSLADTIRPTLTAKVYGSDGSTLARSQSGTWSSSDVDIATITTEADYSGKVTLTGQKLGEVTFTFTADNGTPDDPSDDKTGTSQPYTVTAGDSLALVIPEGASIIVARQNAAATVLWSSNAALFAPDADFQYTIEVFYGHYTTEEALEAAEAGSPGKTPVATYTAAKDQNSVVIPENVLSGLSNGDTPAYTVRVSMPHPSGSGEGVRLSALAWIVVNPEPAQAVLTRPESIYLLDSMGSVAIPWSVDNYNNQTTTLTVIRVTGDDQPTTDPCTLSGGSGIYTLNLSQVADGALKDTYPLFQMADGTVSPMQEMRTASGVVVLEAVPEGEENKPFVARQVVDYHLNDGALIDTRHSTGFVGPNYNFKEAVLTTNMLLWGETGDGASYTLTMADENGYVPEAQVSTGADRYPFTSMPVVENTLTLSEETMTTSGWILDGKDVGLKTRLTQNGSMVQERTMPFRAVDLSRVPPVQEDENVTGMVVTLTESSGWQEDINFGNGGSSIFNALLGDLGELTGPVDTSVFQMLITPSEDPSVFNALIWAGYDSLDLKDVEYKDGVAVSANFMTKGLETDMPSVGDLQEMASGSYDPMGAYNPSRSNRLSDVAGFDFGVQLEGYYEAEIRYNRDAGQWEVCTKGGGFTAGVGMEFGFSVNTVVGIVPVTGSFEVGGAMQLSLQAATRYSQQKDTDGTELVWNDPTATAVTDFLTNLRLRAYVEAFGGFGFDYSLIALKIGLFGKLDVNSENSFLSREYLADESKQQLNGQYLDIQSEVGIKFEAVFALISYEKVLASGSFGYGKSFNNWDEISDYWENTGTGLDSQSIQYAAAMGGLREVSSTATLQSRDYLEQYARSWGDSQARMSLFSLDEENGVENLQTNANPASFPELSDDGQVLVYVSDGYDETTNPAPSIYDSRAHYSILGDDGSYITSRVFPDGGFAGYGDSDVDVAGILKTDYIGGNATAAAAWVRQGAEIPNKDAGDEITAAEQNLLMNSSEIMVSVWSKQYGSNTGSWTTTRLTENATPDLAPAVAVNGEGKAIVFWRSVYSADPESGLMDFSSQDQIMYSYYDGTKWSEAKMLYNGANGSVKGLQAAMLNNGAAIAVYTLDRTGASDGSGQEIGYTIVGVNGDLGPSMLVTSDGYLDENPQVAALSLHLTTGTNEQRFILGWHSQRGGVSDIQLLAVDEEGTISNTFPASLSALTSSGQANIGGDFRFARVWNSKTSGSGYADNLTILWSETVSDETTNGLMTAAHSELKAVRLLAEDTDNDYVVDDFFLTAPQMVAELPSNTLLDHFDAYVETSYADNSQHPIKAVLQATCYDQNKQETIESDEGNVILPGEETKLYTASHNFEPYGLEVEAIGVDYKNLMANSLTPIQFTVRNTGVNEVTDLTVTLAEGESATLTSLQPSESATLAVYHKIGETVSDVAYTITDAGSNITKSGTVYLDYPDIGISQMKVLEEKEGQRTIALTLYNASDAPLASGRTVKVAFYTDSLLTEAANVTYNDNSGSNTITLSGNDLARIDAGACTLVLTYNVKDYVENTLGGQEIPDSGVYLYAEAWAEGKIGTQSEAKRLPEVHSSDNQSAVLLTGAYARTGEKTTLDVVQTNGTSTTATVSLKNNSLQQQSTATLVATLLDENGAVLETHSTGISGVLNGEAEQTADVQFSLLGSRVVVHAAASGEDSLTFDGLPVSMENFVQGPDGAYTHAIYGVTATGTLVTAISGNGETVTIDGEAVNSKQVSIVDNPQTITVKIGDNTYQLTIHSDAAPPATEVTVTFDANGGSVSPASAVTVNGKLASLPTPTREGYDFDGWFTAESGGEKVTASTVFTQNTTIYARWMEEEEPDHGGGSGGGGSTSSYCITVEDSSNGEVTANRETASAGSTITLTVTPDDGYQLAGLTVTGRNGKEITLKDKGDGSYTFTMPSSTVTVEAMFTPIVTEPLHFTDVSDGSYYYDAVNWAVSNGITDGTSATTFSPDNICTRAQMVTFLWRAAGSPTPHSGSNPFVDVPADAYYYTAVLWAVEQGITTGTSVTTFSPDDTVTRSQTVTFLWRYSGSPEAGGSSFADVEADAYYATAVAWAAGEGITSGTSATTFSPYDPCTRAQIVTFLYRAQ